jgi:serine phosphatase RsbU (regulator of sigma subunit)
MTAVGEAGEGGEVAVVGRPRRRPAPTVLPAQASEAIRSPRRAEPPRAGRDAAGLRQRDEAVAELRSRLMPRIADLPSLDVAGALEPVDGVLAGDWFDLRRVGERGWVLLLVDVSGHGAEAGILALQLKQLLIPVLSEGLSPGAALAWAVRHVEDNEDRFATAVVVVGSLGDSAISYANAGHPPPFLGRPGRLRRLEPTGPLLSPVLADPRWRTRTDRLEVGERLIAYTDGVTEARAADGSEFGEERLAAFLDAEDGCAQSVVTGCLAAVRRFRDVARDDSTIAVIRRMSYGDG